MATSTPWGKSDHTHKIAPGITFYGTPSHGGIKVSEKQNQLIPEYMREASGWYEEDCDYAKVVAVFPELFDDKEREAAKEVFAGYFPDEYEKFYAVTLAPGESYAKDQRQFYADHAQDWIVVSAWGHWHPAVPKGMVGVMAVVGGRDERPYKQKEQKYFLVPDSEYEVKGKFGFVVDPARHQEIPAIT